MKILVLYFAYVKEQLQIESETYEISGTLHDLLIVISNTHAYLVETIRKILDHSSDIAIAVNTNIISDFSYNLQENDEIAFIPPISGG